MKKTLIWIGLVCAAIMVIGWFALIIVGLRSGKPVSKFVAIVMIIGTILAIVGALS